ncbi:MAG: sensor histidine kinase [Marivibrio sp.]|uniref:sensor histidine kinase n=1 Tax=Marivibrio sp. TaxID=2039719 RepID=UPI0032EBA827
MNGAARQIGSLRLRLLGGGALWLLLALAAAGLFLSWQFRSHVTHDFNATLAEHLDRLTAAIALDADGGVSVSETPVDPRFQEPYSGLYWQVGLGEDALVTSRSLWDQRLPLPPDALTPGEIHRHVGPGPAGQALVVLERSVRPQGAERTVRLSVARDRVALDRAIARFDRTLVLALVGLAAALGAALLLQVRVGLKPLDRLREALRRLRDGAADRVEGVYPAEIAPAVRDLNEMLARNERLIAGARRQAGDLAHALKTPLAVAFGGRQADDGSAKEALADMQRLIDHHTARARAAGGRTRVGLRTAIAPAAERLAAVMRRLSGERAVEISLDVPASLHAAIDPDDLNEILGVLLDNACKWAQARVRVSAAETPAGAALTVEDDGPGVPAAQRARVLKPGARLDERMAGSGLGLAIADDLISLYGGTLALGDSPLGGLAVTARLPR